MRRAFSTAIGVGVALSLVDPSMDYYEANSDGEGEAILLKAKVESARQQREAGK